MSQLESGRIPWLSLVASSTNTARAYAFSWSVRRWFSAVESRTRTRVRPADATPRRLRESRDGSYDACYSHGRRGATPTATRAPSAAMRPTTGLRSARRDLRRPATLTMRVCLLGTGGGPRVATETSRAGEAILVQAGGDLLLFDCGRRAVQHVADAGFGVLDLSRVFFTHLHSGHTVGTGFSSCARGSADSARRCPHERTSRCTARPAFAI